MFFNGFPSIGKFWPCCCLSVSWLSKNSKQDAPFHPVAYDYSCADWDSLCDHLWCVPRDNIFKLSASVASEFYDWFQVGIDVYIPHPKYQVKSHLSAACAVAIEITFFICTNKISLLNLKYSSDSLVIVSKGFLKLPNLHILLHQKSPSLPRNLALSTFGKLLIVIANC